MVILMMHKINPESQALVRKKEVEQFLNYLKENPWPDGVDAARIHYDELGPNKSNVLSIFF